MPLSYKLNPGVPVEDIARLRRLVGWEPRTEEISRAGGSIFLSAACFDGNKLVGYIDVLSDGVEDALVRNLVVHPGYRRRGIAFELLKTVNGQLKKAKVKTINVLFEPELTELYRRAGFRIICGGLIDNEEEGF